MIKLFFLFKVKCNERCQQIYILSPPVLLPREENKFASLDSIELCLRVEEQLRDGLQSCKSVQTEAQTTFTLDWWTPQEYALSVLFLRII